MPESPLVMHARVVSGTGGGPEKTILNSPRFLNPLGYRSVCVYLRDPADSEFAAIEDRAAASAAPLIAVDDFGFSDWRILGRLREIVQEHQPAIWHGHDYKSNLLGLMLRRDHPMRLVTTVHGWVQKTWKTPLYYYIDRQCLPRYDEVICVSQDLYDDCIRLKVPNENLSLIDNAIALDDYELDMTRDDAKRELGVPPDQQLVVAVGRLSQEKGFDILVRAVANLIDGGVDVGLVIAGGGAEQGPLERLIASTGHGDRIRLLGFVQDPRTLYRAADLYVLSSRREGLPNVVLEAMAMGVPVVATEIAGMPKLIQHDVNGRLVAPDDLPALQGAIAELLGDAELRDRLSEAGRTTVEDRFSFSQRMQKVVGVYAATT
ncbi:glycosyltransferase family 4 protein [Allorhodopirellula solitaria]|uniref:Alpha-D-kanosaminyltransferase n=1 Tax=Allorhodopirellula solitaria TaxID=2527987 RepID=A0A5C5X002_9BACT|nr:glycosyltransferase family 4 protein [Allorhodopirellula solitaria]TWT56276.1 Alpha-D-kanosaminyltransferase [Allorhodopirellula solitaria]